RLGRAHDCEGLQVTACADACTTPEPLNPHGGADGASMHTFIERYRNALTLIGFAAATGAGLALGWGLHPGKELMHEPPAPAIELSNATVLERQPSLAVPSAILEAAAEVRGAKLERAAKLTVQPTQLDCEPLHV